MKNLSDSEPAPITNDDSVSVWDLVLSDIAERRQSGVEHYGTELVTNNGRNALIDAYQEALDLVVYLRQALRDVYDI
jgi:hypothetical protein